MSRNLVLFIIVAVGAMIGTAIVQGTWDQRWGKFPELKEFADRMDNVPMTVGDWKGERPIESEDEILEAAGAERIRTIVYRNTVTNELVHVNLVCAQLQDIFYHTPERCYKAHGFSQESETLEKTVSLGPEATAEFRTATFKRTTDAGKEYLRIFWSWTAEGLWEAPESPKWTYRGKRALYKIYVENPADEGGSNIENSPSVKFIRVFVPELTRSLFPPKPSETATAAINR